MAVALTPLEAATPRDDEIGLPSAWVAALKVLAAVLLGIALLVAIPLAAVAALGAALG